MDFDSGVVVKTEDDGGGGAEEEDVDDVDFDLLLKMDGEADSELTAGILKSEDEGVDADGRGDNGRVRGDGGKGNRCGNKRKLRRRENAGRKRSQTSEEDAGVKEQQREFSRRTRARVERGGIGVDVVGGSDEGEDDNEEVVESDAEESDLKAKAAKRAKMAEYMRLRRQRMTKEEREVENAKIREWTRKKRAGGLTEVEKQRMREYGKRKRAESKLKRAEEGVKVVGGGEEEKEQDLEAEAKRAKMAAYHKLRRQQMTEEERGAERARMREVMRKRREAVKLAGGLSEAEKQSKRDSSKRSREKMTVEQREKLKAKSLEYGRRRRAAIRQDEEADKVYRAKQAALARKKRETGTEEEKEAARKRYREYHNNYRKRMTPEQQAAYKETALARRQRREAEMTAEEMQAEKARQFMNYHARMSEMTPEEAQAHREKNNERRRAKYASLTPEEKAVKCAMQRAYRMNMTPEQRKRNLESINRSSRKTAAKLKANPLTWKDHNEKLRMRRTIKALNASEEDKAMRQHLNKIHYARYRLRMESQGKLSTPREVLQRDFEELKRQLVEMRERRAETTVSTYRPRVRKSQVEVMIEDKRQVVPPEPYIPNAGVSNSSSTAFGEEYGDYASYYSPPQAAEETTQNVSFGFKTQTEAPESDLYIPPSSNNPNYFTQEEPIAAREVKPSNWSSAKVEDACDENDDFDVGGGGDLFSGPDSPPSPSSKFNAGAQSESNDDLQPFDPTLEALRAEMAKERIVENQTPPRPVVNQEPIAYLDPRGHKKVVREPGMALVCEECGKTVHRRSMRRHRELHNPNRVTPVKVKRALPKVKPMEEEVDEGTNVDKYLTALSSVVKQKSGHGVTICDECGKEVKSSILRHKQAVHGHDYGLTIKKRRKKKKKKLEKDFQCSRCSSAFVCARDLFLHVSKMHQQEQGEDEGRGGSTGSGSKWPQWGMKMVTCPICSKEMTRSGYRRHKRNIHGIGKRSFPCTECGKEFNERYHLMEHFKLAHEFFHLDELMKRMQLLGVLLASNPRADNTSKITSNFELWWCAVCDTVLRERFEWRVHMLSEHRQLYDSVVRGEGLGGGDYLSEYPLVCPECSAKFGEEFVLRTHFQTEHVDKCFRCSKCDQVMLSRKLLDQHLKEEHSLANEEKATKRDGEGEGGASPRKPVGKIKFECLRCDSVCKSDEELKSHVQLDHPDCFWPCPYCSQLKFTRQGQLFHMSMCDARPKTTGKRKNFTGKDLKGDEIVSLDKVRVLCEFCSAEMALYSLSKHFKQVHGVEQEDPWYCTRCRPERMSTGFKRREYWMTHMVEYHATSTEELIAIATKVNVKNRESLLETRKSECAIGRGRKKAGPRGKMRKGKVKSGDESDSSTSSQAPSSLEVKKVRRTAAKTLKVSDSSRLHDLRSFTIRVVRLTPEEIEPYVCSAIVKEELP